MLFNSKKDDVVVEEKKNPLMRMRKCTLMDGREIEMTLNFGLLYRLGCMDRFKGVYKSYNQIMAKGPQSEIDNVKILYTAYCCGNINHADDIIEFGEFASLLPEDRTVIGDLLIDLTSKKKKTDSGNHSEKQ